MPLNDDPEAIPDEDYWEGLDAAAAENPMTGPSPDQFTLDDEEDDD